MPEYTYMMRIFLSLVNYDILLITKRRFVVTRTCICFAFSEEKLLSVSYHLPLSVKFCFYFSVQFCLLIFRIEILFVPPTYSNLRAEPRLKVLFSRITLPVPSNFDFPLQSDGPSRSNLCNLSSIK